jgi:hypothetical protein
MNFTGLLAEAKRLTADGFTPDAWVKAVIAVREPYYTISDSKACAENEVLIDSLEDFVGYWNQITGEITEDTIAWYIDMASLVNVEDGE